jgi:hypothetical protein
MGGIFITYRRDDASGYVHAIRDRLVTRFGSDQIFMDIDSIEPGLDFVEVIENSVASCYVVLLLIGKRWQPGRLQDDRDFVRLELLAALERKIRVVPVLLEGAQMPSAEELSPVLAALSRRQAFELSNRHFSDDLNELVALLERIVNEQEVKKEVGPLPQVETKNSLGQLPPASGPAAVTSLPKASGKRATRDFVLDLSTKLTWIVLTPLAVVATIAGAVFAGLGISSRLTSGDVKQLPIALSIGFSGLLFLSASIARARRSAKTSPLLVVGAVFLLITLLAIFQINPSISSSESFDFAAFWLGVASAFFFLAYRYRQLGKPHSPKGAPPPVAADR